MPATTSLSVKHYALTDADKARIALDYSLGLSPVTDPLLCCKVPEVPADAIGNSKYQAYIADMFAAATNQQATKYASKQKGRGLVGLAAPQIGIPYRIILVDTHIGPERKKLGKLEAFINPQIIWRSRETYEDREGCFSTGLVWGLVRRPIAIKIQAYTAEGKPISRVLEDFTARIFQHEIDHLDGIRFPERIKQDSKRHWVHTEELPLYIHQFKKWPRHCSVERWERSISPGTIEV